MIEELKEQNIALYYENLEVLHNACLNENQIRMLKTYNDYLYNELDTDKVMQGVLSTEKNYILNGWFIASEEKKLEKVINGVPGYVKIKIEEPLKTDNPPSLVRNNKVIAPYESITNLYSPPSKNDLDPNIFVALFYFIFFGIMIGDIGYGIIMFVAAALFLLFYKPKKGMKDLVMIICMGGVSAIIWGVFFGSFFGLEGAGGSPTFLPSVIDPINDALTFLIFTLGVGVVHIVFGLVLKFANLVRQKRFIDAICDSLFRITLFVGLILVAVSMFLEVESLSMPGIIVAVASAGLIFLTAGRNGKGIFGKLAGGFGGLYSLVNYVSDILSYARLFGLGLVGAVIAMVANIIAGMLFGIPIIGIPIGILVALVFHAFNLALGLLSAYVHNARLQFVEFFGKFYEGGGKEFTPLGNNTKHIKIKSSLREEK